MLSNKGSSGSTIAGCCLLFIVVQCAATAGCARSVIPETRSEKQLSPNVASGKMDRATVNSPPRVGVAPDSTLSSSLPRTRGGRGNETGEPVTSHPPEADVAAPPTPSAESVGARLEEAGEADKDVADVAGPAVETSSPGRIVISRSGRQEPPSQEPSPPQQDARAVDGIVPRLSEEPQLPNLDEVEGAVKPPSDENLRQVFSQLLGDWKQVDGGNDSDFAEGGYRQSEIRFTRSGRLQLNRVFDSKGDVQFGHEYLFIVTKSDRLQIRRVSEKQVDSLIKKKTVIQQDRAPTIVILPAAKKLPLELPIVFRGSRLFIGGKEYSKQ